MLNSQHFRTIKLIITRAIGNRDWMNFWEAHFLPRWLPLLLGLGLAPLLAFLIIDEAWAFVFALVLLVPLAILFNAYPFAAVVIWLLVMPFFVATPTYAARYVYWILHRAMIPVALGMAILSKLLRTKKHPPFYLGRAELAMAFFLSLALTSTFLFQPDVYTALPQIYDRVFIPFCMYGLVRLTAPGEKGLKRVLPAALIMTVAQSVIGILSWFAPQVLPPAWLAYEGSRTVGSLRNPAQYTSTLTFLILLLFQAAMNRKPGLTRSIFLFAFGLGAICVFLSFSRGSWLGGLFAGIGLLLLYPRAMSRMTVILLILMAVLQSGLLSSQMAWAAERLETEETVHTRIVVTRASFEMIKIKPVFGWGYDNFDRYSQQFHRRVGGSAIGSTYVSSHNTYLTIMVELGLVSFFFYVFPFGWWLMLTIRVWPRMPRKGFWSRPLLAVLWLAVGGHIIPANFINMAFSPFAVTLWWLELALIADIIYPYLTPDDRGTPRWARQAIRSA